MIELRVAMWIHVSAYLVLSALLGVSAWRLTVASRVAGYVVAVGTVGGMVAFAVWMNDDVRWVRWIPGREVWLWSNLTGLGGATLAGVATRALPPIRWQRALLVAVLLGLGLYRSIGVLWEAAPKLGNQKWNGMVCRQTTLSTCGPCAVASALAAVHVHTTEREMSREGLTSVNGTSNLGMYRALVTGLEGTGRPVGIYRGPADGLSEFPAVVSITVQGVSRGVVGVGGKHAVAVIGRSADGRFYVADPFVGLQRWTPEQLAEGWCGWAMVVR
jgi:hypothetical protein